MGHEVVLHICSRINHMPTQWHETKSRRKNSGVRFKASKARGASRSESGYRDSWFTLHVMAATNSAPSRSKGSIAPSCKMVRLHDQLVKGVPGGANLAMPAALLCIYGALKGCAVYHVRATSPACCRWLCSSDVPMRVQVR